MSVRILIGDVRDRLAELPDESVHCVVTSPPYYGLRDYGVPGQIGLEKTPDDFIAAMVSVFSECRRVLRKDGTLWLNLGDSYANDAKWGGSSGGKHVTALHGPSGVGRQKVATGLKPKDLLMIPSRVAIALQADGWWLRSEIIWHKPNPMPESVTDRPTSAHEKIYLLSRSEQYWYDQEAVKEPVSVPGWDDGSRVYGGINKHGANVAHGDRTTGRRAGKPHSKEYGRKTTDGMADLSADGTSGCGFATKTAGMRNQRNVWTVATHPYSEAHFATFPPELPERCIKAGCPVGGTVLDPFGGAGTTGLVADRLKRDAILIELNPAYAEMARKRIEGDCPMFAEVAS